MLRLFFLLLFIEATKSYRCDIFNPCKPQHPVRKNCVGELFYRYCSQCNEEGKCGGDQTCITSNDLYLCGTKVYSSTATCPKKTQAIWTNSDFYCLSCDIDNDCRDWSNNPNSKCSNGICSPAFLSCGEDKHCLNANAAECRNKVCSPCTSASSCSHLSTGVSLLCIDGV